MLIKGRLKLIRKHDCDFWNLTYYRVAQNRFFHYFKFSLIHKIKQLTKKKELRFLPRKTAKMSFLQGYPKSRRYFNPFLNELDKNLLNVRKQLNFYKLFLRRGLRFVTYIYKKCFYYRHAFVNDLLLGVKSSYRIYKPFNRTSFEKKKMFFKQITLFYNNFDNTKLKRFGRLGRKGQFGGINYFFLLLESRIDSIVLRLNLGSKFLMRELIRSRKVLVEGKPITYLNYIVKKNQIVSFTNDLKELIYASLHHKIPIKMFFVQPPFYFEINYRTLMVLIVPKLIDPSFVAYPFLRSQSSLVTGLHTVLWGW